MNCIKTKTDEGMELKIEGELTITKVDQLKQTLLVGLDCKGTLTLDLTEVTDCDTANIQVLMSARKTARKKNKELLLTVSTSVEEAATRIGLEGLKTSA